MIRRLALNLVSLYPETRRQRYGVELRALLAEQAIGPRVLVDLVRGSADAHLRPGAREPAVVLGGGRLILDVLSEALAERRRPLARAVCAPFAAVAGFAAATGAVVLLANRGLAAHTVLAWIIFLSWLAIGLAGAAVCGLAPRAALRLAHPRPVALRSASADP